MEWALFILPLWIVSVVLGDRLAVSKGISRAWCATATIFLGPIGVIAPLAWPRNDLMIELNSLANGERKRCPDCAELVRKQAKVCRYCRCEFT